MGFEMGTECFHGLCRMLVGLVIAQGRLVLYNVYVVCRWGLVLAVI